MSASPSLRSARVRAPELVGRGGWIGTGGQELSLAGLRGKVVLLDFWTFCCVNCLHVLDELRPLEERFADVLVTVGVHSPKFAHEADHAALVDAVERYDVHHPVLDDPDLTTWKAYAVRAWPTLAVVDPEGYVVAQLSGEGHGHSLAGLVEELVAEHEAKGTLHRGDGPYVAPPAPESPLRFPAKVLALPDGTFLVADTGHRSLVQLAADAQTVLRRIEGFAEPQGLCLLPTDVAAQVGYDALVADTAGHLLRGVCLADGSVRTVAGTGRPWMRGSGTTDLSSPWDLAWHEGRVVVAMAGTHQLWTFDPASGALTVLAGTTNEGLLDGDAPRAWLAQPSGLAVDGSTLWFADAETSALRRLRNGVVHTAVGQGLFDFGHRDGPAADALLQHPLGVTVLPDGSVAVSDTYNGAVRRYDPASGEVTTLAGGLAEPSDAVLVDGDLLMVESAAHRLTRLRLPEEATLVDGAAYRTQRPPTDLAPGVVTLEVVFEPPAGQHLDDRYGPSTHCVVSAAPPELLAGGAGSGPDLRRDLVLAADVPEGVLHVSVRAASCDEGGENPACHVHSQDWGVPVRVVAGGETDLRLYLRG